MTGCLAGLLPALKASSPSLIADLRGDAPAGEGGGAAAGRCAMRWSSAQVALTAVLLVVAGLLLRSLGASQTRRRRLRDEGPGRDRVRHRHGALRRRTRSQEFWRQALARVQALPGVSSAGLVSPTLPFTFNFNQQEMRIDNRTYNEGQRGEIIENVSISPTTSPRWACR